MCVCQQAQRSTDFALRHPDELWQQLQAYYEGERLACLERAVQILGDELGSVFPEDTNAFTTRAKRVCLFPAGFLASWRWFSSQELGDILRGLRVFRQCLNSPADEIDRIQLVTLRMFLHQCQYTMQRATVWPRFGEMITRVEHFYQNEYLEFESINGILVEGVP